MSILAFLLIILLLDVFINLFTKSFVKILGMDFLFVGSWLAGIEFGIFPGILISVILLFEHSLFFLGKSRFILFSFPVQILAVFLGFYLGADYLLLSLIIYQLGNLVIMALIKAIGPRFIIFLFFNTVFSLVMSRLFLFLI